MTDLAGLTPNQRLALDYMPQGEWFFPEATLVYINSRFNTCQILAERGILFKQSTSRFGQKDYEFMLPVLTAKRLGITHREAQ